MAGNTKEYIEDVKRSNQMVVLWNSGVMSMSDIGAKLRLTRERVRQILNRKRDEGWHVLTVAEWKEKNNIAKAKFVVSKHKPKIRTKDLLLGTKTRLRRNAPFGNFRMSKDSKKGN